ncbi:MAG: TonB-dependent receptor [Pseudomonadota bacterium]
MTSAFTTSERSVAQEFKFEADGLQVPILGEVGFVAGVNFAFSEEDVTSNIDFGAAPLIASTTESVNDLGVFADLRFRPVEKLELGVGARFTRSAVELEGEQAPSLIELPGLPPIVIPGITRTFDDTFTAITPRGSARYDWTDDFSTYVAISTGFRPGGFNPLGPSFGLGFEDERVINYEGGFRASFLDDRLDVSGTGFALFYDDIQITSVLAPGVVAIGNAGKARSIGSEVSINARPLDGLSVGLGYGLALTRFTDFDDASGGGVTTDLTGERLPNAPVNTFRFTMDYARPVLAERADAFLRVEHSYTSDAPVTDSATPFESGSEARNLVNLRTGFRAENWELEFFVENLFDARFQVGANATAIPGVIAPEIGDTRRFGARGKIRF